MPHSLFRNINMEKGIDHGFSCEFAVALVPSLAYCVVQFLAFHVVPILAYSVLQ